MQTNLKILSNYSIKKSTVKNAIGVENGVKKNRN